MFIIAVRASFLFIKTKDAARMWSAIWSVTSNVLPEKMNYNSVTNFCEIFAFRF